MYLDNKLVFLAGATGLVGSNVMNYTLQHHPATRIRACYHRHTPPFIHHERVEYVYADLKSPQDCHKAVQGCDCAIMAAFASAAGASVIAAQPWKQVNDNLFINAQLLETFAFEKLERVVCLGSITLYQEFAGHIREDELDLNQDPHPAYFGIGWVARFIEKLCRFWHDKSGLEIVMVRTANVFGPYARFDPQTSNFIPAIIRKAVDRMEPFEVWGTPDVTRDVVYSEDFARAVVMMLNDEQIKFDVFNVGSGAQTTVADVVTWALQYVGHQPQQIVYRADKPTTNRFRALDCSKARRMLGWQPRYTIEEGVKKTTEWWLENKSWWRK
jgi:nucleoside-diphosphate-sugar epimerase